MTDPVRDDAKLQEVFDYAKSHEEQWDQSAWRSDNTACGTTYCLAGFATWVFDQQETVTWGEWYAAQHMMSSPLIEDDISPFIRDGDGFIHAEQHAIKMLGLTEAEADALFSSSNDGAEQALKEVLHDDYR